MPIQNLDFLLDDRHNPGYFPDREDPRDLKYRDAMAMGAVSAAPVDWTKGYDTEKTLGFRLTQKAQNGSSSCVGQTFSEYQEGLNYIETGKTTVFSAKAIYAQIYIPSGGAYTRDAADICVNKGGYLESDVLSYENGNPPSEEFMRRGSDITETARKNARTFGQRSYFYADLDIEMVAQAIRDNGFCALAFKGTNQGWRTPDVRAPKPGETVWGHQVLGKAFGIRNGKRAIKFQNHWGASWGENGDGWIDEDYFALKEYVHVPLVLVDRSNAEIPPIEIVDKAFARKLEAAGKRYVQLVKDKGQVYRIDGDWLMFLDSEKNVETRHIPLVDEAIHILGPLITGITNEEFKRLTGE